MLRHVNANVVMGFYYFPRGGSAQVARYLCRALGGSRWAPTLFAGSIGSPADSSNAHRFFSGICCESLDYSPAWADWSRGADPMAAAVPMPASYEDKAGVPDRIFFALDDAAFNRQVTSWTRFFTAHTSVCPSVVHLHHLTPMHEAVRALWPGVPVITHLHGTELKMLASVRDGTTSDGAGRWTREWVERMRRWACDSERLVVVAAHDEQLVQRLMPVDPARITTIAHGVDTEIFSPRSRTPVERLARWKRWLVDDPRGWRPDSPVGSIRYDIDDLAAFTDDNGEPVPVVTFAGRFVQFKRLQLLIEAHHVMRSTTARRSVLVVVGGFPGEWEGEHPHDTVRRLGAEGVFFAGWRDHVDLADILNCSDVFAAPSVDEPFGLVYLEAMSAGLPPIATNTGGPLSFINVDPENPTGWLVPPDDVAATTRALAEAVSDHTLRTDRGTRAAQFVREHYSWATSANVFAGLYAEVIDEHSRSTRSRPERPMRGVA
ncbi:MAG: glycosyltransferase family 4 protein [Actinomycetota bacterium]|nr:glycosyltransferase family 4 protein [Actinomycetota bacterium]